MCIGDPGWINVSALDLFNAMDLGLGNLTTLKTRLLPATMQMATYDATITQIGAGVAAMFDKICNRKMGYAAAQVDYFSGDRLCWIANRFPVVSVASIQIQDSLQTGWVALDVTSNIQNRDDSAGLFQFGAVLGSYLTQCRITYAGGYWYDTTEDSTGSLPANATALPADLKEAWLTQCESVWDNRDKLGISLISEPEKRSAAQRSKLVPIVEEILRGYIRFQIS